jgi:hypothetical protein
MYNTLNGAFMVTEGSDEPRWSEHFNGQAWVEQHAPRTVVLRNVRGMKYANRQSEPTRLFLEGAVDIGADENFCRPNQQIWARSINNENHNGTNFYINGGWMWTMSFKSEGNKVSFEAVNGGVLEVLGGYRNETSGDGGYPMLINRNSNVSFIAYSSMASVYQHAVQEERNGVNREFMRADMPPRLGYMDDFYITLYTGYDNSQFPLPTSVPRPAPRFRGLKAAPNSIDHENILKLFTVSGRLIRVRGAPISTEKQCFITPSGSNAGSGIYFSYD